MTKILPPETLNYLLDMYNKIWEEGEMPKSWKYYNNTPAKGGKKPKRCYRSVALKNILCKIFERMTNERLVWYLAKENKIDERQFGFRKQETKKKTQY